MGEMNVDGRQQRSILLAVPQDGLFAPIMQAGFAGAGWPAVVTDGAEGLLAAVEGQPVALVVLDMVAPGAREALQALKLKPETSWIPVVALFPRSSEALRRQELRVQADVELTEPVEIHELIAVAERKAVRSSEPPSTRKVCLVFPSRRADLERAVEIAGSFLGITGLEEAAQTPFLAGIREAIGNAIQHGNRNDPTKLVRVECRQNPATVTITVRDEGPGFDAEHHLRQAMSKGAAKAARDRHRAGGQGGLGMLMLVRSTDRIRYSKTGNLVTLTKFIGRRPP